MGVLDLSKKRVADSLRRRLHFPAISSRRAGGGHNMREMHPDAATTVIGWRRTALLFWDAVSSKPQRQQGVFCIETEESGCCGLLEGRSRCDRCARYICAWHRARELRAATGLQP
jgi:hypothetical protein